MLVQESIGTAVDAIKANKLRSILTTLAIIIGTAAVIAMVAMGSSAHRHLMTRLLTLEQEQYTFIPALLDKEQPIQVRSR